MRNLKRICGLFSTWFQMHSNAFPVVFGFSGALGHHLWINRGGFRVSIHPNPNHHHNGTLKFRSSSCFFTRETLDINFIRLSLHQSWGPKEQHMQQKGQELSALNVSHLVIFLSMREVETLASLSQTQCFSTSKLPCVELHAFVFLSLLSSCLRHPLSWEPDRSITSPGSFPGFPAVFWSPGTFCICISSTVELCFFFCASHSAWSKNFFKCAWTLQIVGHKPSKLCALFPTQRSLLI